MKYTKTDTTIQGADARFQKGSIQKRWGKTVRGLATLALIAVTGSGFSPSVAFAQANGQANSPLNEPSYPETLSDRSTTPSLPIQLSGQFHGFMPGTNHLLIYHNETDTSSLQDAQGREIAILEGLPHLFSPDGAQLITYALGPAMDDPPTAHLYDALGNKIADLDGTGQGFSPDSQYLVTLNASEQSTNLYNVAGEKVTVLIGYFASFSPHRDQGSGQVATFEIPLEPPANTSIHVPPIGTPSELSTTHLYNLTDNTTTAIPGTFSKFNSDGSRIVTYGSNGFITAYLYDFTGREIATLPNQSPAGFYGEEGILGTIRSESEPSLLSTMLYDRDGGKIATLEGALTDVNEAATRFITDDFQGTRFDLDDDIDYLYDLSGRQIRSFPGSTYWAFTPEGDRLLSNSFNSPTTYVYDAETGEELAAVDGMIADIAPDGNQFVVYTEFGGEQSHFYDGSANKLRSLPGIFKGFSHTGDLMAIVEYWDDASESLAPVTHIYDQAGYKIASVEGAFESFSEDDSRVVTYDHEANVYRLLIF